MTQELEVLKLVCQRLEHAHILYMLTGSFAANFYAVPRMTRDIDIVVEIPKESSEKVYQIFKGDFYIDRDSITEAVRYQGMFNIIHNESVFKIDFIVRKDSEYRSLEFQRRRRVALDNTEIYIVSPEDLIISKLIWAKDSSSEMQIKDVRNIFQSLQILDKEYLLQWIKKLKLDGMYEKVINNE